MGIDLKDESESGVSRLAEAMRVNRAVFSGITRGISGPSRSGGVRLSLYQCGYDAVTPILSMLGMSLRPNEIHRPSADESPGWLPSELVVSFAYGDDQLGGLSLSWYTDDQSATDVFGVSRVTDLLHRSAPHDVRTHHATRFRRNAISPAVRRPTPAHHEGVAVNRTRNLAGLIDTQLMADLSEALTYCHTLLATHTRDSSEDPVDALLYTVLVGHGCEAPLTDPTHQHDEFCGGDGALAIAAQFPDLAPEIVAKLRRLRLAVATVTADRAQLH